MPHYVIGVGGTGARCLEAFTYLAASGVLKDSEIRLLGVDQDDATKGWDDFSGALKKYGAIKDGCTLPENWDFFKPNLESAQRAAGNGQGSVAWKPLQNDGSLGQMLGIARGNNDGMAMVAQTLFRDEELQVDLKHGFGGRTNVGATILHLALQNANWVQLFPGQDGQQGLSVDTAFLMGSFFGGTGASGLPTLGTYLASKTRQAVGAAAVGPYFKFTVDTASTGGKPVAHAEHFLERSQAALYHYGNKWEHYCPFNRLYLVGDVKENWKEQSFARGGNDQDNTRHHAEMLAALAAVDFLQMGAAAGQRRGEVLVVRSHQGRAVHDTANGKPLDRNHVQDEDLPLDQESRKKLHRFTALSLALASLDLEFQNLRGAVEGREWRLAWLGRAFTPDERSQLLGTLGVTDKNQDVKLPGLRAILDFSKAYIEWVADVHHKLEQVVRLYPTLCAGATKADVLSARAMGGDLGEVLVGNGTVLGVQELHACLNRAAKRGRVPASSTSTSKKFLYLLDKALQELAPA